jgi:succinate-semialdehyde dehydrogenase/glutarate-semialdehyde dehydrogenase
MSDYAVVNPATGETVKEYPTISDDDLRDAIGRADKAVREWSASTTVEERAQLVRRVGEIHAEQRERLAGIIVREMGKPVEQALAELDFCSAIYEYYADNAPKMLADEEIELLDGDGSAYIRRSPYGTLLGIMPWNFPYYQVARFAGPNLAIGNAILLKHAPQCPESAEAIQEIYIEAGFPADAYINIYASNEQIEWVENAVAARVDNTGQSCNAAKRFIVVDDLYEPFLEKFTDAITKVEPGDPTKSETEIGPLSSSLATERLADQLQRAIDKGAKLVAGGEHDGNFFKTTVLTDIGADNPARHEEFFGPVAQVYRVKDEAEAVELANDTPYGLGSYLMTTDAEQARRVAEKIEAGMVFVNLVGADGAELPFGGVKRSGFGRELGRYGIDEFVNKKLIRIGG